MMHSTTLKGKKIMITAGPTREAIDPVRYISNHSSGKMGYAIAEECLKRGAEVYLVSGPVGLEIKHSSLKLVKVNSASEMYTACRLYFEMADAVIFAAAVADYRPAKVAEQKIKKEDTVFTIQMVKNVDIAYEFGKVKRMDQLSVGFALETENEHAHAVGKLRKKNFDLVVLNSMNDKGATFGFDTNKITVLRGDFSTTSYSLKNKKEVAEDVVHEMTTMMAMKELYEAEKELMEYETMYR